MNKSMSLLLIGIMILSSFIITIDEVEANRIPTAPIVSGPQNGTQNQKYAYTAVSFDEDNDTIQYHFDWGDGSENTTEFLPNNNHALLYHKDI